jgi:hypothetical protein
VRGRRGVKKGKEGKSSAFRGILTWANSGPQALNYLSISKSLEKVNSTALICRRCLSFNPQPQNQTLDTYELSKPSAFFPRLA